MIVFSEVINPFILFFVSSVICKSIEIDNETVLNNENMNQINLIEPGNSQKIFNVSSMEQDINIESSAIQGMYVVF